MVNCPSLVHYFSNDCIWGSQELQHVNRSQGLLWRYTMPGSAVGNRVERKLTLNAICLKKAVLCVDCDVVSDSPHDYCLVCGSRSLFNVGRLLGGMPKERAKVIDIQQPLASTHSRILTLS